MPCKALRLKVAASFAAGVVVSDSIGSDGALLPCLVRVVVVERGDVVEPLAGLVKPGLPAVLVPELCCIFVASLPELSRGGGRGRDSLDISGIIACTGSVS